MKKSVLIPLAVILVFCMLLTIQPVFSAVSGERQKRVLTTESEKKETKYQTNTINSTHRVIGFSSLYGTYGNFWNKINNSSDWYGGKSSYSSGDIAYLQSFAAGGNRVNILVDLTGRSFVIDRWDRDNSVHGINGSLNYWFPNTSKTTTTTSYKTTILPSYEEQLDPYTVVIHESKLITKNVLTTTENINYQMISYYCESPIILDLDGNDTVDTAKNRWKPHDPTFYRHYAKFFDINGDGNPDYCEWMKSNPGDGLLAMPENGTVTSALQLFGTAGGYRDGYEKLSIICDKDNNGWVEGEELNGLKLWIDSNNNAVCDDGELKDLSDYGVTRISTNHKDYIGSYVTKDGKLNLTWDWWPTMAVVRKFRD